MLRLAGLILMIICGSARSAVQPPTIVWLTDDRDDLQYYLSDSPYSIGMDTTNMVLTQLKEFDIRFHFASVARMDKQLQDRPDTCVANRIKTPERARHNQFSLPLNVHLLARLYYNNPNIRIPESLINDRGQVTNLRALLDANPGTSLALLEGISFGVDVDQQLQQLSARQVTYYNVDNRYQSGPKLLKDGFVDFALDYPSKMRHHLKTGAKESPYQSIGLAQAQQFVVSHIACSDSALGKSVIARVNHILKSVYAEQAYIDAHLRHTPEANHQEMKAFVTHIIEGYQD
ncbi:hypothetical protein [Lacimicrobium sp. SS2-24]|uniref:hypothetical protein n=1 Tax=Lacimicrobium sp. SS2-24 TaxID=2005569 RepID=UPI000B4B2443|nr:hypothetical protein [Lacimicrobium sp. SS2-24]